MTEQELKKTLDAAEKEPAEDRDGRQRAAGESSQLQANAGKVVDPRNPRAPGGCGTGVWIPNAADDLGE